MSTRTNYLWSKHSQHDDIDHILIDEATLQHRVAELGQMISCEYAGRDLLLVAILKGSIMFTVDLMRHITIPHEVDFMATSSYNGGLSSSGTVRILQDLKVSSLAGRNVLLVEDIIDSGRTISHLLPLLQERQPGDIRLLSLLDKPQRREVMVPIDWIGFSIPDEFVVGYGLDYAELYRNLPYIGVLKPRVYRDVH